MSGHTTDPLADDMARLVDIAERVLAGEPLESFDLGQYEVTIVSAYCQHAVGLPVVELGGTS